MNPRSLQRQDRGHEQHGNTETVRRAVARVAMIARIESKLTAKEMIHANSDHMKLDDRRFMIASRISSRIILPISLRGMRSNSNILSGAIPASFCWQKARMASCLS